jgi:NADH dehydrogenase [ubiquinone] 1 alpha subcomplex assembly factor 7
MSTGCAEQLRRVIRREGPISFSHFMDVALYAPGAGFFATGGGAGRAGRDFLTAPEVGPLFGACVARALDGWWRDLGSPDPFVFVEAGAGRGRLAREILRAQPACLPALHYVLVERSAALRAAQAELLALEPPAGALGPYLPGDDDESAAPAPGRGPIFVSLSELPARISGVVFANELLDNLPFDVVESDGRRWHEVRVGLDGDRFVEVTVPAGDAAVGLPTASAGARLPCAIGIAAWLAEVGASLRRGRVVLVDYVAPRAEVLARGGGWLRTYRAHGPGAGPLADPGSQDITADVVAEDLDAAAGRAGLVAAGCVEQGAWLAGLGIGDLVAEGERAWREGAHRGDLAAVAGRSRGVEAAALTDPDGLGSHRVCWFDHHP